MGLLAYLVRCEQVVARGQLDQGERRARRGGVGFQHSQWDHFQVDQGLQCLVNAVQNIAGDIVSLSSFASSATFAAANLYIASPIPTPWQTSSRLQP